MVEIPLRGRRHEISVLAASIGAAARGRGGVVWIEAGVGSGRTSLMEKAVLLARRDGLRCLCATATVAERGTPLKPLLDALGDAGPIDGRVSTAEEIERRLAQTAARTPVVIAIDDVHEADDATLLALRTLPGRLSYRSILWILTSVPGRADMTARALSHTGATLLRLAPLDRDAAHDLACDVLRGEPTEAVLDLVDDLDGHPSFIVELLHALVDEGIVDVVDGTARLTGRGVRRALCELGVRHPQTLSVPGTRLGLTRSELAVAELVAQGATNRQAAEQLFISPHTVNSHLRNTFEKLGIRSRVELAVLFREALAA